MGSSIAFYLLYFSNKKKVLVNTTKININFNVWLPSTFHVAFALAPFTIAITVRISTSYIGSSHQSWLRSLMAILTPTVILMAVVFSGIIPSLVIVAYLVLLLFSVMFILGIGSLDSIGTSTFTVAIYVSFFICFSENMHLIPLI